MITILFLFGGLIYYLIYAAAINGVFKLCPYCKKIGSWRYDKLEPQIEENDEDGQLIKTTQLLSCRSCHKLVVEVWSDFDGRSFLKQEEAPENVLKQTGNLPRAILGR